MDMPVGPTAVILALRPLLENTPRSPIGPNTPERLRAPEDVRRYLDDVAVRAVWEECPRCRRVWNALPEGGACIGCIEADNAAETRQIQLGEYLLKTIGPYGIERYTFAGFDVSPENEYAFGRFQSFDPVKDNLFAFGPCGTGKTHLAGALLKAVCAAGLTVKWTNPIYLARALRSRWASDEGPFVESLVSQQVLIIDDLGVGKDTNTTLSLIYEIIDRRRHKKLNGLVLTSNQSLDELAHAYRDDRIFSRIAGMCEVVQVGGPDRRQHGGG